jgi:carboxypeptidase C (cathepsin A)
METAPRPGPSPFNKSPEVPLVPDRSLRRLLVVCTVLALCLTTPVLAQERAMDEPAAGPLEGGDWDSSSLSKIPEDRSVTTRHSATIGGERVDYTATAGQMVLREEDGTPKATVFYIAYERTDDRRGSEPADRPLTFSFNGGPGSSSVWLHLGTLGPRRVAMTDEGLAPPPPYRLEENPFSLLDVSDLVFIDPVSTGFSRPVPGVEGDEFHGLTEDVESVGQFIRRWVSANGRWASPKFLIGESYGTTRASGLVHHLQDRHGMYFNGVMLISSILNFQTARFDVGNDLPYMLFLPTYTATAWYHGQLPADLQDGDLPAALAEAEEFALGDYARALHRGDDLSADEERQIAQRLARLTGLDVEFVLDVNLRPQIWRFVKELRRDEGVTVGRLDSRFEGHDREDAGDAYEFDPSYAAIQGPYTAMLNAYVRDELGFETTIDYEILGGRIRGWSNPEGRYVNVAEELRRAMTQNEALRVHVANGYYDLATPYFATAYTFDHLFLPEHLRGNVSMSYYRSGHMMYIRLEDAETLKEELAKFVEESVGGR